MADVKVEGEKIDQGELDAAFRAVRAHADRSAYGKFISDAECHSVANEVVLALADYHSGREI